MRGDVHGCHQHGPTDACNEQRCGAALYRTHEMKSVAKCGAGGGGDAESRGPSCVRNGATGVAKSNASQGLG